MVKVCVGTMCLCHGKGGSERSAVNLAHELLRRGHEPHLVCLKTGQPPVYPLNPHIKVHFAEPEVRYGKHEAISGVRKILSQTGIDVFISMQSDWAHMLWALSCLGTGIPFICSERSDPRHSENVTWSRAGRHAVLASADFIHELLPAHLETIPELWRSKAHVIPAAAPARHERADPAKWEQPVILFLARFVKVKRASLLLEAFRLLAPEFPTWKLQFVGYGVEETAIQTFIRKNGLAGRVSIRKPDENIFRDYAAAQIYCLPTRIEGFPNTALEAMSVGLPVTGVADCPAMRSLAAGGSTLLAPEGTPAALASTLKILMESPELRKKMGQAALRECQANHDPGQIYDRWENLLARAAQLKGNTQMDAFGCEPFASMATLSAAARREWLYRNFGEPMPYSARWFGLRGITLVKNILKKLKGAHLDAVF